MDDFLSQLPLSIIHTILELVPIQDAVKTSVLSTQWRYKWATLFNLDFDGVCRRDESRMINFINQALFLHKGPVHKFKLYYSFTGTCDYFDQWLIFLSRNDIKMLIIQVDGHRRRFCIHSSLYSCQNLTHLELFGFTLPRPPPTFKEFLSLKILCLCFVALASSTIESIVANSPLLEVLTLDKSTSSELSICAPNLKYFYLEGHCTELFLNAPLLAQMTVINCFKDFADRLQHKNSVCKYIDLFGGITKLEELDGDASFLEFLSIGFESCHDFLVFHHLRVIKLSLVCSRDIKVMSVVFRLITGAPNLQELEISCDLGNVSSWDSECLPNFTFERLKVIKMKDILGELHEMRFIKFLLASSPMLEKMICETYPCHSDQDSLRVATALLRYRRASTNAEILFIKI